MQARHRGIVGAAAVVLLGLVLHRAFLSPRAHPPAAALVAPIERAVPGARPIELIERIEGSFKDIYLTQISIIQGVAFGFLARSALTGTRPTAGQWIAYGTAFMVITIVWQEYMVGSTAFTWVPTLLDSVTPYVLGILEFLIIIRARESTGSFLLILMITWWSGWVSYGNYWYHARRGGELNRASYALLGRYVRFGLGCHLVGAPAAVLLWVLHHYSGKEWDLVFLTAAFATLAPLFLHSIFNWSLVLYRLQRAVKQ
ncbi:hypothetical protein [Actinomadura decatromicini]|uniref:Uncharacterized protein n=1 Tax=Actinomadura decatromicini TaxID=2604572 RepID=A0A5D3FFH2_9ACTN|nr:hypothetical protein [Actinomadura decatromicini]TYK46764.1 hypothetical protein FXF68_23235 [Actinomadura decatromicini]